MLASDALSLCNILYFVSISLIVVGTVNSVESKLSRELVKLASELETILLQGVVASGLRNKLYCCCYFASNKKPHIAHAGKAQVLA